MPQATDLVIKNAAGADKTFTLYTPASGYGTAASWNLKEGATRLAYPSIDVVATRGTNSASTCRIKFRVPIVVDSPSTGLPQRVATFEANATVVVPDAFPEANRNDAVAYLSNIMANAVIKACYRDGVPAN